MLNSRELKIFVTLKDSQMLKHITLLPYRMKIYTELIQLPGSECFNLQNKINISEFWPILILSFNYIYMYIRYHWKIFENLMVSRIYSRRFAISEIAKYRFQWNFFPSRPSRPINPEHQNILRSSCQPHAEFEVYHNIFSPSI